jgi:peptidoglycan/LPS O-acetylase OafA/YrhL
MGPKAHVPGLDGLRGIALLGVLAFHADGALAGGFLGVDLFFVLSGFLITRLLLLEHERDGKIDLAAFWLRRARRLLPALLSLMLAIVAYAHWFARADEIDAIKSDAVATLGYFANWRAIYSDKSYWDLFSAPSPLQHTWSLAIEEQFYLVWPPIVLLALRRSGKRWLALLTGTLAVASAVAMVMLHAPEQTSRVYFGTDTRASSVLVGALFAMLVTSDAVARAARRAPLILDGIGVLAAVGIAVAWYRFDSEHPLLYRGGFWLTELATLALIACALAGPASLAARALSALPLRLLGTISYGAYLWHWPVHLVLTEQRTQLNAIALEALRLAVTLAIATISYRFFERPIREGRFGERRAVLALAAGFAAAAFLVGVGIRPRPGEARLVPLLELAEDVPAPGRPPPRFRVAVHGDSTANSFGWTLRAMRDRGVAVVLEGDDGLNILSHEPSPWSKREADAHVVFLGGAFLYRVLVEGRWKRACHPRWNRRFEEKLGGWVSTAGSRSARIWLATVPYPLGEYDTAEFRREVDCINRSIRTVAENHEPTRILELAELLCPRGTCTRESHDVEVRPDGVHFSVSGARSLAREVLAQLERGTPSAGRSHPGS